MALKSGRVGVDRSQVDAHGKIIKGSDSYTKQQADSKFATKNSLTANHKQFYFDYDTESKKYGFRAGDDGEFQPFNSGGGAIGTLFPYDLASTEGITLYYNSVVKSGGYYIDGNVCYVDMVITMGGNGSGTFVSDLPIGNGAPAILVRGEITASFALSNATINKQDNNNGMYISLPGLTNAGTDVRVVGFYVYTGGK